MFFLHAFFSEICFVEFVVIFVFFCFVLKKGLLQPRLTLNLLCS